MDNQGERAREDRPGTTKIAFIQSSVVRLRKVESEARPAPMVAGLVWLAGSGVEGRTRVVGATRAWNMNTTMSMSVKMLSFIFACLCSKVKAHSNPFLGSSSTLFFILCPCSHHHPLVKTPSLPSFLFFPLSSSLLFYCSHSTRDQKQQVQPTSIESQLREKRPFSLSLFDHTDTRLLCTHCTHSGTASSSTPSTTRPQSSLLPNERQGSSLVPDPARHPLLGLWP